ncbi:methyl-accepting chemotaxis protein [Anaeroselena agilis]|uniref:Methyl-accepting chemotaxis protein n=1 Tax=Anaeroselena agilis TaxID=3063788 RepID=A0ABU3P1S6_9FIRM|nr:methyl-accepting chemotaxis protein [Selenomonadales bacterium 4137-cl]
MQLKVGTKITLGFVAMMLMVVILGAFFYYSAGGIKDQVGDLQKATTRLTLCLKIENEYTGAIGEARGFVAYGNEQMLENFSKKLQSALEMEKQILELTNANERSVVEKLISDTSEYIKGTSAEFVPLVREQMREQKAGNLERAKALQAQSVAIGKKYVPFAQGIMKGCHSLVEENTNIVQNRLATIQQKVQHVLMISLIIGILSLLVAGVMTGTIPRYIKKSLVSISVAAGYYAEGDLSKQIPAANRDEFGDISRSINDMVCGIKGMIGRISQSAEQVAASSQQLTASAAQSSQAASQVAASIGEVAGASAAQLAAANEASAVVEEMSAGINQVAANTNRVAEQSARAAGKAKDGGLAVDKAVAQMRAIEINSQAVAENIATLNEKSKDIGQIVDTIASIAGQTNLLALNAAIEAARAGEQGRGFAVVAEEVRKLAEESQAAAKKIAEMIGEIQGDTDKAVAAMNEGALEVKTGAEVVNAAGTAFREIVDMISQVSSQVGEISAAVQQMASGSQQIVDSVKKIDNLSKKSAGESQSVSAATEEQLASMEEIASSSEALAKLAQDLQIAVAKFRV